MWNEKNSSQQKEKNNPHVNSVDYTQAGPSGITSVTLINQADVSNQNANSCNTTNADQPDDNARNKAPVSAEKYQRIKTLSGKTKFKKTIPKLSLVIIIFELNPFKKEKRSIINSLINMDKRYK